ncbi:MAG: hypothetical protein M3Y33_15005 [Actinomycetota bacterium]|nr:hypothetical protein [Actinomycetota bacterium]
MDTPPQPEATGHGHAPASTPRIPDQRERPPSSGGAVPPSNAALSNGRSRPEPTRVRGHLDPVAAPADLSQRIDWAQCMIAAQISAEHSGWDAGHDLFGWYAVRLDDGHTIRASGPSGLKTLIGVVPPFSTWHTIAELRRAFPAWHIWRDSNDWHARRRGNFRQDYRPGAPLYAVHGSDAAELRSLLEEQSAEQ